MERDGRGKGGGGGVLLLCRDFPPVSDGFLSLGLQMNMSAARTRSAANRTISAACAAAPAADSLAPTLRAEAARGRAGDRTPPYKDASTVRARWIHGGVWKKETRRGAGR